MQQIKYPPRNQWQQILLRPAYDMSSLQETVKTVLNDVKQNGDSAIKKYTSQFDGVTLEDFIVSEQEINEATAQV